MRETTVGDLGWSLAVGSNLKYAVVLDALEKGMATQFSGNPLQYSGLENSMGCVVYEVTKSRTELSDFHLTYQPSRVLNFD